MIPEEILIVNDGSLLLKMIGGLLEHKGYHLSLTDSPEEALVRLSSRNIVLVVMKLNGRQPDRLAVLHMVKELNGGTKLIVVGDQDRLPAEIFEIDADDYVILPCRVAEIWRRLARCLEAPVTLPGVPREDGLIHPVNQRVFHNLGLMFHDMRGLLTSVNEGMKILDRRMDGRLGDETEAVFQKTYQKTRTLLDVCEDFFGKFQNCDRTRDVSDRVDLQEDVIYPVVQEFGEELQNNHITLENRLSLPPQARQSVRGDRVTLKSVFRNLLSNAITHGGCGCTISIELDESPGHFRLQVHNSASTVSSDRQQEMFAGKKTARHSGIGMGLGLHLGREVMRSQGGDISYETCKQGSNFIMTMPRA
jgi:two-component system sensor histidine kinase/response regulator